jgi:nicotinamide riboside kinase
VPIRSCTAIAVEGTHSSGKTTLAYALTSYYKEQGLHVSCVEEPARSSPFMEEIVLLGQGDFDVIAELDAFGQQISTQLRAARHQTAVIVDKTFLNVVAYAKLLLPEQDSDVVDAMLALCRATAGFYDAVLYTTDVFSPHQPGDLLRAKVASQQQTVDIMLRELAEDIGLPLIEVPQGLATVQRVEWSSAQLRDMGVLPALA